MAITHRFRINLSSASGTKKPILESGICTVPARLVRALIGDAMQILVLKPD